jgi:hypothetical protein
LLSAAVGALLLADHPVYTLKTKYTMAITYHFQQRKDEARPDRKTPIYLRITQNRKHTFHNSFIQGTPILTTGQLKK